MKTAEYIIESLMPCRGIQSRSKMVREGKLGIPQNHSSEHRISDEEQKMTIALIYISLIAAITALLTLLHYSLKSVFMAKNYHDKLSIADGAIDLVSFDDYKLNTFNMSMVVIKEMTRIAVVINASVNVFITF